MFIMARKSSRPAAYPKTHSNILWHFTGGPQWDAKKYCQSLKPKSQDLAFNSLCEILKSKTLALGVYHELLRAKIRQRLVLSKGKVTEKEVETQIQTSPVCCVADIPASELWHHAKRYGQIAIGWHRKALVEAGFNPVFYVLEDQKLVRNFYLSHSLLNNLADSVGSLAEDIISTVQTACEDAIQNVESEHDQLEIEPVEIPEYDIESALSPIADEIPEALSQLKDAMAFIKTHKATEFETIYAEREWRSVKKFNFKTQHVAAIILPRAYYQKFLKKSNTYNIGPDKIQCWENLFSPSEGIK